MSRRFPTRGTGSKVPSTKAQAKEKAQSKQSSQDSQETTSVPVGKDSSRSQGNSDTKNKSTSSPKTNPKESSKTRNTEPKAKKKNSIKSPTSKSKKNNATDTSEERRTVCVISSSASDDLSSPSFESSDSSESESLPSVEKNASPTRETKRNTGIQCISSIAYFFSGGKDRAKKGKESVVAAKRQGELVFEDDITGTLETTRQLAPGITVTIPIRSASEITQVPDRALKTTTKEPPLYCMYFVSLFLV